MKEPSNKTSAEEALVLFETYLLTEKRVAQNSFLAYKSDLEQFVIFLKEQKTTLFEVSKKQLKFFLKWLYNQGIGARSVARKISTLKLLYTFLHEKFDVVNCAQELLIPHLEKKLPLYLTLEELDRLFEHIGKDISVRGIRNRVMIYLMYATGMRVSELLSLTVDSIQFQTGFITVVGKGSKERSIPVPAAVLKLLSEYLMKSNQTKSVEGGYLFCSFHKNGVEPLTRQTLWLLLKKMLTGACITKKISPHSLRHSLATHLLAKGVDLRLLQLLLGHEQLATVQIYTHLEKTELRKIYDKKHPRA